MNRKELKENAKKFIKGKKWIIWQGLLMFLAPSIVLSLIYQLCGTESLTAKILTILVTFFTVILEFGIWKYILCVVRGEECTINTVYDYFKDSSKWGKLYLSSIVVSLVTAAASLLFVVPGIIMGISLTFYMLVLIDNDCNIGYKDLLHKCHEMMNGHKMELFILGLSFIGWEMLATVTFGLLYIWLLPYQIVTNIMFYEQIRK